MRSKGAGTGKRKTRDSAELDFDLGGAAESRFLSSCLNMVFELHLRLYRRTRIHTVNQYTSFSQYRKYNMQENPVENITIQNASNHYKHPFIAAIKAAQPIALRSSAETLPYIHVCNEI